MESGDRNTGGEGGIPSLTGTVMKGASLAAGGYAVAQAANLVVYLVLARLLSPDDFGVFAAATVLLGFMTLVTDSGMVAALVHREERMEEAFSTAAVWSLIGGTALALVALAVAPLIGIFFGNSQTGAIAAAMAGIVLLRTLPAVPSAILQRNFSFVRRIVVDPLQVIVFGAVAIYFAAHDAGPWALVAGQYAGAIADVLASWLLISFRPRLRQVSVGVWRELVSYGRHVFVATIILRAGEQSDAIIVGRFLGEGPLGQFRYAFRLALTPFQMLLAGAAYVLFPAFARISGERERFRSAFMSSLRWMSVCAFPSGLILVPLGVPLAVLLFGPVWREAGYAAMAMSLYCGASCMSSVTSEALKAAGRPERLTRMHTITAVVTIIGMVSLVPFGLAAAAAGLSIGAIAGGIAGLRYVEDALGTSRREMLAEIWPPLTASIVMALSLLALDRGLIDAAEMSTFPGLIVVLLEGGLAVAIYLLVLRVLSPPLVSDLLRGARALPRMARSRFRRAPEPDALEEAEPALPGDNPR